MRTIAALGAAVIPAFVNPAAGSAADVTAALRNAGCFEVHEVPPDRVMQAVESAVREGASRIVAAGGDGTISAAAAAIARSDVELAVVPAGTAS